MVGSVDASVTRSVDDPFAAQRSGHASRRLAIVLQFAAFPVAVLILWQVCAQVGFVRRNVLPAPSDVIAVWYDLISGATDSAGRYSGTWFDHALASTWRVYAGFAWGVALGVTMGLLIGLSRIMERVFDPTVQVLRNIPVTAWVPLSLVFFGIGNAPAIFLIGLGAFFPAVINTTHGVRQVDVTLYKSARMMGAKRRRCEQQSRRDSSGIHAIDYDRDQASSGIAWVLASSSPRSCGARSGPGYLLNDAYLFYRNDVVRCHA